MWDIIYTFAHKICAVQIEELINYRSYVNIED